MASLERISFANTTQKLIDFKNWLISNRLITDNTRFEELVNNMNLINIHYENGTLQDLIDQKGNMHLWYALTESTAYTNVFDMLVKLPSDKLPRRAIKEALGGPFFPFDEKAGDQNVNSRNRLFELEFAAKLHRANIEVTGFDDVEFLFNQYRFFTECKRLISKRNIPHNILGANRQLQKKLNMELDRGIIALAAEKVLELDNKILVVDNAQTIKGHMDRLSSNFFTRYQHIWARGIIHPRIIAVVFNIKFIIHILDINILSIGNQLSIVSLVSSSGIQPSDRFLLLSLAHKLEK